MSCIQYGDPRVQEAALAVLQNLSCRIGCEAALSQSGVVAVMLEALRGTSSPGAQVSDIWGGYGSSVWLELTEC